MPARLVLTGILVIAVVHALLEMGRDVFRRTCDETLGPLGPREP